MITPLERIVKHLMINYPFVPAINLMNGRMGGVLFFCEYAKYTGKDYYYDYAFDLFESIYNSIPKDAPLNFRDGLCGIGWGAEYLLQNEFMEGNSDKTLKSFDTKIMELDVRRITDISLDTGLSGILLYVLTRLESFDRKGEGQPFDKSYLSGLFDTAESYSKEIKPELMRRVLDYKAGKPDFNRKPRISDIIPERQNSTIPDDLSTISVGIEKGLTAIAFNLIAL